MLKINLETFHLTQLPDQDVYNRLCLRRLKSIPLAFKDFYSWEWFL